MEKFKAFWSGPHRARSTVALLLGGMSLAVLLVAFQLNFQQQQLYTQVVRINDAGEQELMIFRDYRDQQLDQIEKMLSDCLQRNEIFGDGTGEVCAVHRAQKKCIEASNNQEEIQACLIN